MALLASGLAGIVAGARAVASAVLGTWATTGSTSSPRAFASATALGGTACQATPAPAHCGQVLLVGGTSGEYPTAATELYDPASGKWTPRASTNRPHGRGHFTVMLTDGRVLVVGGSGGGGAEVYDPLADTWRVTGAPADDSLYGDGAALLPDGRVLRVSGRRHFGSGAPLGAIAETYDPSADGGRGGWTPTAPMPAPQATPTVTVLGGPACAGAVPSRCGQALVVGAGGAELYDPARNAWTPTLPPAAAIRSCDGNSCHSATLLADGRVLVLGGDPVPPSVDLQDPSTGRQAQIYDPAGNAWTPVDLMPDVRSGQTATRLPTGSVLVAGGAPTSATYLFDPSAEVGRKWTATGPTVLRREGHATASLADGRVLVVGGAVGSGDPVLVPAAAELYEPGSAVARPSVLAVQPGTGRSGTSTTVRIHGMGLDGVQEVRFGADPAVVVGSSPTEITAVAPDHAPATVDVTVTTSSGASSRTSATTPEDRFSWHAATVAWTATTPAGPLRTQHTATPLPDGTVLVAGGRNPTGAVLGAAEVFDPSSGTWAPTGALAAARAGHAAVALPDGRVLVTGGEGAGGTALASTEVYDPVTRKWRDGGAMGRPRTLHTATLLGPGGAVLVAGGQGPPADGLPTETLASAEMYQPGSGRWAPLPSPMGQDRAGHAAMLLDGDACGSAGAPSWCRQVLVAGGSAISLTGDAVRLTSAELFDPASGTWSATGSMLVERTQHAAVALTGPACAYGCGQVLVAGGSASTAAERYVAASGSWVPAGRVHDARSTAAGVSLPDGNVLLVGGGHPSAPVASAEVFDPATGEWSLTKAPATPSASPSATVLPGGRVLVAGINGNEVLTRPTGPVPPAITGVDPPSGPTFGQPVVKVLGRGLGTVTAVRFGEVAASLVAPPTDSEVVVVRPPQAQGTVTVTLARSDGPALSSGAGRYTYASGAWVGPATPPACQCQDRSFHTATLLPGGKVLVSGGTENLLAVDRVGGQSGVTTAPVLASAEIYDPTTRTWAPTGPMADKRFQHTATLLADGTVLVVGGQDEHGAAVGSSERFFPDTGTWRTTGQPSVARFSHTATALGDGRVLVTGGAAVEDTRYVPLASAEIYDPVRDTWAPAGPMTEARASHAAVSLGGSRVLVAGGLGGPAVRVPTRLGQDGTIVGATALESAEIFDAATGVWRPAAPLGVGRSAHTATALGGPACAADAAPAWCGDVLVAGGTSGAGALAAAEVYDLETGTWEIGPLLQRPRSGHTATRLDDGAVVLVGGGPTFPGEPTEGPLGSAEVLDPATGGRGTWDLTSTPAIPRAGHAATVVPDGSLVVTGGYRAVLSKYDGDHDKTVPAGSAEVYVPAPRVRAVLPASGPVDAATPLELLGSGFSGATEVRLGDARLAPAGFTVASKERLTLVAPPRAAAGRVDVSVSNAGGTSAHLAAGLDPRFVYVAGAGRVNDLIAEPVSGSAIRLSFSRPDDGAGSAATRYVIEQAGAAAGGSLVDPVRLCPGGICTPAGDGAMATLVVEDLLPATPYFYLVRAEGFNGELGPPSAIVSATTLGSPAAPCAPSSPVGPGQVAYPARRYSLVGLPAGTVVRSDSPLYGWFDLGAGGQYSVMAGAEPTVAGRGYWAWFACPRVVDLAAGGPESVRFDLGAYRAAMVGNPRRGPATLEGHDFAARWDPALNGGAGGYVMSGYRAPVPLATGEGAWTFSYASGAIDVRPGP